MARSVTGGNTRGKLRAIPILACAGVSLLAGACSQLGSATQQLQLAAAPQATQPATKPAPATDGRSELLKATEYWGEAYTKNPRDAQAALNYARNLKALGEKRQALAVLQQASAVNGNHRGINAEYARLAIEFDQISLAQKLLEQAEDPANPDWRIISAHGTVLAKQARYREAIAHYERALTLAPDQPSLLNNLALAYAMEGEVDKAEPLLKRAVAAGGEEARLSQNLALVLSLQGKYDEAKLTAVRSLPADKAAANVEFVRSMVQLDAKPLTTASLPEPQKDAAKKDAPQSAAKKDAAQKDAPKKDPARKDAAAVATAGDLKGAETDDGAQASVASWTTQVAATKPKR